MLPHLLFAAAALASAGPTPPAALTPYIAAGRFDPGDYGWYKGALSGAGADDQEAWKAVQQWLVACAKADRARTAAELAASGVAVVKLEPGEYGDDACGAVSVAQPRGLAGVTWAQFTAAVARARPIAQTVIWSSSIAQTVADPDHGTLAEQIYARPMTDQVLRFATTWNDGMVKGAPDLDPVARSIAIGMIWSAIRVRDHANTAWLKAIVAKSGWPTIAQTSPGASHFAWLLVQHADDDPVFQYKVLGLMKPLATDGQISKTDYGYLYDRVMLKIAGTQRYGTQAECRDGQFEPRPLEDAVRVDAYRRDAGMSSLADNLARLAKMYGACRK